MKKNRHKNYLKIGILLFGISLILTNCEKDEPLNTSLEDNYNSKVKLVEEKDIPYIIDFIENNTVFGRNSSLNRSINSDDNSVDVENALRVIDSLGNINHTFRLNVSDNDETTFYNLVIHQNQDNDNPNAYVFKFEIEQSQLETLISSDYNFSNFTGSIKRYSLNAFLSNTSSYLNRGIGVDDCICEETPVTSGGNPSGGGGGSALPGGGSPLGSAIGSEDPITCVSEFITYYCNGNGLHNGSQSCSASFKGATVIRTSCTDGSSSESGNIFSRSSGDDCNNPCEDGNIGETAILLPKPLLIINELEDKSLCVYNKLNSASNNFRNAIKKFDGEFPVAHLKLEVDPTMTSNTKKAFTRAPENYIIDIVLNGNPTKDASYQKRPNLLVAKTIIHEVIHAEMFRKLLSLANDNGSINVALLHQMLQGGDYPGMLDYYFRNGNDVNSNWQHQQIAQHYRETIARILQEFDTGDAVPDNQQPEQLYLDLSWEGLIYSNIVAWQEIMNDNERTRIENVISDYIANNPNQTCRE